MSNDEAECAIPAVLPSSSDAKPPNAVPSQEIPSPAPAVEAVPNPMLCLADREDEPWYADGVDGCVTGIDPEAVLHQPAVLEADWKSGDDEKDAKSRLGEAPVPHMSMGIRLDGGGVCKAERAAVFVMYAPPIASLESWNGSTMLFSAFTSIAGEDRGVNW